MPVASSLARLLGIVFILVGVAGFIPAAVPDGKLLGLFHVNAAHNAVHIALGVWGVLAASGAAVAYLRGIAVIYAALAVLGLIPATQDLFGLTYIGGANVALHGALAVIAGYVGFVASGNAAVPGNA
jgi:hypothetical protein